VITDDEPMPITAKERQIDDLIPTDFEETEL
jgi:hypothetical protein